MMESRLTRIAFWLMVACAVLLTIDAAVATWRRPADDAKVKAMQVLVKNDAAVSPKLDAELKQITTSRQMRKRRDTAAGWVLIASAGLFLLTVTRNAVRVPKVKPAVATAAAVGKKKARRTQRQPVSDTELDLSFVDAAVARIGSNREAAIPLLQAIQTHYRYLPEAALRRVCELTPITPAQLTGTATFYGQFRRKPVGKHIVKVCHGTACHVAGARQITEELRRTLGLADDADTDPSRTFTLEEAACLGCCSLAPVLMVDEHTAGKLTPATANDALDAVDERETA